MRKKLSSFLELQIARETFIFNVRVVFFLYIILCFFFHTIGHIDTSTTHIYIYIYIYICVCVCIEEINKEINVNVLTSLNLG